jgi:UTP-glucose-1-phosphate uridylyltransferase
MNSAFRSNGGVIFALMTESSENTRWSDRWHLNRIKKRLYAIKPRQKGSYPERGKPRFVGAGRYLISPEILDYAEHLFQLQLNGELGDGMIFEYMCDRGQPVHGIVLDMRRFDISTQAGYIGAWQAFGRSKPIEIFPPKTGSRI